MSATDIDEEELEREWRDSFYSVDFKTWLAGEVIKLRTELAQLVQFGIDLDMARQRVTTLEIAIFRACNEIESGDTTQAYKLLHNAYIAAH